MTDLITLGEISWPPKPVFATVELDISKSCVSMSREKMKAASKVIIDSARQIALDIYNSPEQVRRRLRGKYQHAHKNVRLRSHYIFY